MRPISLPLALAEPRYWARPPTRPTGLLLSLDLGDWAYKVSSGTTSGYGRYVKSLGEPRGGPLLPCAGMLPVCFVRSKYPVPIVV